MNDFKTLVLAVLGLLIMACGDDDCDKAAELLAECGIETSGDTSCQADGDECAARCYLDSDCDAIEEQMDGEETGKLFECLDGCEAIPGQDSAAMGGFSSADGVSAPAMGSTLPPGMVAGTVPAQPLCTEGQQRCDGALVEECEGGEWVEAYDCDLGCTEEAMRGEIFTGGFGAPLSACAECESGEVTCVDDETLADCIGGHWREIICAGACSDGRCLECEPDQERCENDEIARCSEDGYWEYTSCFGGGCTESEDGALLCVDFGTTRCSEESDVVEVFYGVWEVSEECSDSCEDGVCICEQGATRCAGREVEVCDASHSWELSEACEFNCTDGECSGACGPGEERCQDMTLQQCDFDYLWDDVQTCEGGCTEQAGGLSPLCLVCEPGERRCDGDVAQECTGDGWSGIECSFGCRDAECLCEPKSTRCVDDMEETCDENGEWLPGVECPAGCQLDSCAECEFGNQRCVGNERHTCSASRSWQVADTCTDVCVEFDTNNAACRPCSPGTRQCSEAGDAVELCSDSGYASTETTCEFSCIDGACTCPVGASRCLGTTLEICEDGLSWTQTDCWPQTCGTTACEAPAQVVAGGSRVCAITAGGDMTCWSNINDWPFTTTGVVGADVHGTSICVLRAGNAVECFIVNNQPGALAPPIGLEATDVAVGDGFACAIQTDQSLMCWGDQFGASSGPPAGLHTDVAAGGDVACALDVDGAVDCWGFFSSSPGFGAEPLSQMDSAGEYGCGIVAADDRVFCWGDNGSGQATAPLTGSYAAISAGGIHTCALTTSNDAVCWGNITEAVPTSSFQSMASGNGFSCGITLGDELECWGDIGDGAFEGL